MKNIFLSKKIIPLVLVLFLFSCTSRKEIVYYQNINEIQDTSSFANYEIKIQPDDLLSIIVSAEDPEIAKPFNLGASGGGTATGSSAGSSSVSGSSYLVDVNGFIDFPVIGKIKVGGLLRSEVTELLQNKITKYIKQPVVTIRLENFKIAVQGEVNGPGIYSVGSERITLIEALSNAKDLTIYGKRDNILIIRENNGVKTYNRVDITKANFINSPYYYLAQNDVVYVEPNKTKINNSKIGADTGLIFSITSILITVVTLIIRLR